MILAELQVVVVLAIAFYLVRWRRGVRRRNAQSWETLMARLRTDWSARELSDHFLWQEGLNATPDDAWRRMEGPRGLWAIYQNACILQEMAGFAVKNCQNVDRALIETLHSDAVQIRVCVLMALAQYGFAQTSEGVRINAYRAAVLYTGMAARMRQLLQDHAGAMVPDFVAAM